MAEYVVDVTNAEVRSGVLSEISTLWGLPVRERIVRCRDCKHHMSYWKSDYCDYFSHVTNDPDGFCKWGVRRTDG